MISDKFFTDTVKIDLQGFPVLLIRELFDEETLSRVSKEVLSLSQQKDVWQKLNFQEHLPRKKFHGEDSKVFNEVIDFLNTEEFLTKFEKLSGYSLSKINFHLWWDTEGYTIPMHVDNEAVNLSMQIYIGESKHNFLGTSFGDPIQDPIITLPYLKNTGYFLSNPNIIQHGLISEVPKDFDRFSLYFYLE